MLGGDWVRCVQKELGTIVWVSNPVAQRLTVFSEDASVSKFFFRRSGRFRR